MSSHFIWTLFTVICRLEALLKNLAKADRCGTGSTAFVDC